jgi:hypothetical protein
MRHHDSDLRPHAAARKIMSARARALVYAAFAMLALGFTGTFAPSRGGLPTPHQGDSVQPGEAGTSGAPREAVPTVNQSDSAKPLDAVTPSAPQDHLSPRSTTPRKVTHARPQRKMPPRTGNPTTLLNHQEMIRHRAGSQPQRDGVSAFLEELFR